MRKITTMLLVLVSVACVVVFTGCGDKMPYDGVDISKCVKVGEYKGLKVDAVKVSVEPADKANAINEILANNTEQEDLALGTEVKNGDVLTINYVGRKDGKKFEGGSADGASLELGSNTFIDGFESGLVGKKVGDKKIILNLTFPENYGAPDLAGQDAEFTVDITAAQRTKKPEYNDAFVKKLGDYKNTEDFEKQLEEKLLKNKKTEAENKQKSELWEQVVKNSEVTEYPEDELNEYIKIFNGQIDFYAEQYGVDRATLLEQMYGTSDENEVNSMIEDSAKGLMKEEMIVEYIADKEGLTYTDEEVQEVIANVEAQGYDEVTLTRDTGRNFEQYAHIELLFQKVQNFVLKNANIK